MSGKNISVTGMARSNICFCAIVAILAGVISVYILFPLSSYVWNFLPSIRPQSEVYVMGGNPIEVSAPFYAVWYFFVGGLGRSILDLSPWFISGFVSVLVLCRLSGKTQSLKYNVLLGLVVALLAFGLYSNRFAMYADALASNPLSPSIGYCSSGGSCGRIPLSSFFIRDVISLIPVALFSILGGAAAAWLFESMDNRRNTRKR